MPTDLNVRGGGATNASQPRHHLTPALLAKPVSLLTVKELRQLAQRAGLDVMKASQRQPDLQGAEGRAQPRGRA